jgi:YggT family protein
VILSLLCLAVWLFVLALFAVVVLSWFPLPPGSFVADVRRVLNRVVSPVLDPLRRILPPVMIGGAGLDLAPMIVAIVAFWIVLPIVCG